MTSALGGGPKILTQILLQIAGKVRIPWSKKFADVTPAPIPNAKATKDTKDTVICHAAAQSGRMDVGEEEASERTESR